MNVNRPSARAASALVGISLMALNGCIDYTIETTLEPDGSGTRSVRMDVTDPSKLGSYGLSAQEFREVMHVPEAQGWEHAVELNSKGDTVHVFRQEQRLPALPSWSEMDGQIGISLVPPSSDRPKLGYLDPHDVFFQNRIWVRLEGIGEESRTLSYQEHFLWEKGTDAMVEFILTAMERSLQEAYPRVSSRERGEILGSARANLWSAIENGALDAGGGEDERFWRQVVDRTTAHALPVVRGHYPQVREDSLRARLDFMSEEVESGLSEEWDRTLPGISLAFNTSIHVSLTMPGRITSTNAHGRDGNTLSWDFSPGDAFTAPVVLVAESQVGG